MEFKKDEKIEFDFSHDIDIQKTGLMFLDDASPIETSKLKSNSNEPGEYTNHFNEFPIPNLGNYDPSGGQSYNQTQNYTESNDENYFLSFQNDPSTYNPNFYGQPATSLSQPNPWDRTSNSQNNTQANSSEPNTSNSS